MSTQISVSCTLQRCNPASGQPVSCVQSAVVVDVNRTEHSGGIRLPFERWPKEIDVYRGTSANNNSLGDNL